MSCLLVLFGSVKNLVLLHRLRAAAWRSATTIRSKKLPVLPQKTFLLNFSSIISSNLISKRDWPLPVNPGPIKKRGHWGVKNSHCPSISPPVALSCCFSSRPLSPCHVIILLESLPLMQLLVEQAGRPRTCRRPNVHVCIWKKQTMLFIFHTRFRIFCEHCAQLRILSEVCVCARVFCKRLPAPPKNCGSYVPDSCRWVIYVQVSVLAINFISRRQRNMIVKSQSGGGTWERGKKDSFNGSQKAKPLMWHCDLFLSSVDAMTTLRHLTK